MPSSSRVGQASAHAPPPPPCTPPSLHSPSTHKPCHAPLLSSFLVWCSWRRCCSPSSSATSAQRAKMCSRRSCRRGAFECACVGVDVRVCVWRGGRAADRAARCPCPPPLSPPPLSPFPHDPPPPPGKQLVTYLTYYAPVISPRMWTLYPAILEVRAPFKHERASKRVCVSVRASLAGWVGACLCVCVCVSVRAALAGRERAGPWGRAPALTRPHPPARTRTRTHPAVHLRVGCRLL